MINLLERVRLRLEKQEENLSPFASRSPLSKGRLRPEPPCPLRTAYQQDRDRIIHSKAFRRLKHKTQVFIAPQGDHYITRLTHTLQVAQIARTIARSLNLNEDLTEAIALAHDLGHTPFGHIGEEVLNKLLPSGFQHSQQSLRVVDLLENNGQGLNLAHETRQGILYHSKPRETIMNSLLLSDTEPPIHPELNPPLTLEAQVVSLADSIAYINHDLADSFRAGIICQSDLPKEAVAILGDSPSKRIDTIVRDLVFNSWGIVEGREPRLAFSPQVLKAIEELREFLFEKVYNIIWRGREAKQAQEIVEQLFYYFYSFPDKLPVEFQQLPGSLERKVADYIAGMTDQFALNLSASIK